MLKDNINKIISKREEEILNCTIGTITRVYEDSCYVDVEYSSKGINNLKSEKVPLPVLGSGIVPALPNVGDNVVIVFLDNSLIKARIVSYINESYKYETRFDYQHKSQGSYLNSMDFDTVEDIPIEEFNTPLKDTWMDTKNTDGLKYFDYVKTSPFENLVDGVAQLSFFDYKDVGIINPVSKSLVKIKKDGIIDIFTNDNQGIKIDPINKAISITSDNIKTNSSTWNINVDEINIKSKNFNVHSENILLNSNNLDIQTDDKNLSVEEIIKGL